MDNGNSSDLLFPFVEKNMKRTRINFIKKSSSVILAAIMVMNGSCMVFAEEGNALDDIELTQKTWEEVIPEIEGLTYESSLELDYAERFDLHYYNDGYAVIDIYGSAKYLVVPEGMPVPELAEDMIILQKPLDDIYLTATSAMALFDSMGASEKIKMLGTDANGWYIDSAVDGLNNGSMVFAGKYSEPDYELLINQGCDLSVQSTMILHTPKVKEMLEDLGIPVMIEYSTYEQHPLGKPEWAKLYGFLTEKEEEAAAFMEEQKAIVSSLENFENTEKTVAYFYVNTNGQVVVREVTDYIPGMIEMAGGRYIFKEQVNVEADKTTAQVTMEEFYNAAVNADYLIYNASIDSPISTLDELFAKSELFADFKAVKEGNVWCTGKSMFQATDKIAEFILDINLMLTGAEESEMTFFNKVQ